MLQRTLARLPRPWRVALDWIVTIAAAVGLVLAIKAWVVNPYRIPSSSMEPTLHCARPAEFRGWTVPDVLLSGDHARIADWRLEQSRLRTADRQ